MILSKDTMLTRLPQSEGEIILRSWTREDTEIRASWPPHSPPFDSFNWDLAAATPKDRDHYFHTRQRNPNRIDLAVDHTSSKVIGLIAFTDIDWNAGLVENMAVRFSPEWCSRGFGTSALQLAAEWARKCGLLRLRLDVSAANRRAVRCYEKVGFYRIGDFWRDDTNLQNIDIQAPAYGHVRPYIRRHEGRLQVEFWWMELDLASASNHCKSSMPC